MDPQTIQQPDQRQLRIRIRIGQSSTASKRTQNSIKLGPSTRAFSRRLPAESSQCDPKS
ncbi:MAG: hypothetical protein Q7T45_20075 [Bradyrhizobium sp.]|uniref:hypothetical protein n=1 Tax=Bradyrhizobium sp. TaxID=376 RepID=UPI0027253E3B|nr:hypothetical protein [Bradyrhizobium sp.]MDO8400116.1 hypothetical protein [Bradyrhizobium sp.]